MKLIVAILLLTALSCTAGQMLNRNAYGVKGLAASGGYTPTASTNLVLWWTFNTGNGSYQADQSGNGNYGTQGTVAARCVISNSAGYFGGTNLIQTVATNIQNGATEFTATCWINYSAWATYSMLWGASDAGQTKEAGFQADVSGGKKVYGVYSASPANNYVLSGATFLTNAWTFLAVAGKSGTPVRLYVDGVESRSANASGAMSINAAWAAGGSPTYVARMTGFVDDTRIYNRSLTSNELVGATGSVKAEGRQ